MRNFLTSLTVSALVLGGAAVANAADFVEQVPEAPAAQDLPGVVNTWEGAYVGGAGTYNAGRFDGSRDARAIGGQLYGGYNWQSGPMVYGAEADVGYSGADEVTNGIVGKNKVNGSIRGRVGYDANPVLVYGTAGVAAARNSASDATSSDTRGALGVTIGAGVEAFVTNNVTTRLEYRYTNYQDKNFNLDSGTFSRGYDEHSVKVGIGVKF